VFLIAKARNLTKRRTVSHRTRRFVPAARRTALRAQRVTASVDGVACSATCVAKVARPLACSVGPAKSELPEDPRTPRKAQHGRASGPRAPASPALDFRVQHARHRVEPGAPRRPAPPASARDRSSHAPRPQATRDRGAVAASDAASTSARSRTVSASAASPCWRAYARLVRLRAAAHLAPRSRLGPSCVLSLACARSGLNTHRTPDRGRARRPTARAHAARNRPPLRRAP
jgi:hypothetical protein